MIIDIFFLKGDFWFEKESVGSTKKKRKKKTNVNQ